MDQRLKVKGLDIYIPPLTLSDQQRFTIIRSGVLTGNDIRWCSARSGNPLPEWTDFGSINQSINHKSL